MKTIKSIKGKIKIPKRFQLSKNKKMLKIKMSWSSSIERLLKDNWRTTTQIWFRHKGQKPFIPVGFIEIDGERFKVIENAK